MNRNASAPFLIRFLVLFSMILSASAASHATTAATPTFSPAAGSYTGTQSVTISDTTSGATIYYTTNGSTPSSSSTHYTGAISVSTSETIKAIAEKSGDTNSSVASAAYTITVSTPTFSPAAGSYTGTQSVTISDATSGATIYYTTNGSTPTSSSTQYTGVISVSTSETVKAIAELSGATNSAVASAAYTITLTTPTFSPVAGSYTGAQPVTISDANPSATIYYTTNGSTPTSSSTQYSGVISVSTSETIKAIAELSGATNSAVVSAAYTIIVPTPTFSLTAGNYIGAQTVTINDSNSGAACYYTLTPGTTGTTPTTSSTRYSSAISVSVTSVLESLCTFSGDSNSAVASAAYTIIVPTPTFSLAAGSYIGTQTVTINDSNSGAACYYTLTPGTTGTTPTTSSTRYSSAISVSVTSVLESLCSFSGDSNSAVASAAYTIIVSAPTFSPVGGTYNSSVTATINDSSPGAICHYTVTAGTVGTTPTTSSTTYSAPILIGTTSVLEALCTLSGDTNSAIGSVTYIITPPAATPTFSPVAGTYTSTQTVTLGDSTSGATIYYTTNGTTPTTSSSVYSSAITVSSTETLEAIATAPGYSQSAVGSAVYTITPPAATPTFSPGAGFFTSTQTVTISDSTSGATVYYTTDGTTPTTSSSVYSSAITVSSTETLKAIATASGYSQSAVGSATYSQSITPGTPTSVTVNTPGQSAQLVFSGTAGQLVSVLLTNGTIGGCNSSSISILNPDGSTLASGTLCYQSSYFLGTATLPTTGTYTVVFTPLNGNTGSATLLLSVFSEIMGGQITPGTPTTATVNTPGQNEQFTFSGTAGLLVSVLLTNGTIGGCNSSSISILNPDGSTLASGTLCYQSSYFLGTATLPTTGTYTVVFTPLNGNTGSATLLLSMFSELMGGQITPATPTTATVNTPGQNEQFTFSGTVGQWATVQLTNGTIGGCNTSSISILNPNGSTLVSGTLCYQSSYLLGPATLPTTGTYTIVFAPQGGQTGSAEIQLTLNSAAATPTSSIPTGTYTSAQTVTLSDATAGATIFYTTDGTPPTTNSAQYTGPITVSSTETIEAIASAPYYPLSAIASFTFTITSGPPTIAAVSPGSGVVGKAVTISGSNFGSPQNSSTVILNGQTMPVISWGGSTIVATVPTGATSGNIVVSVGGVNSNGFAFTVADPTTGYYRAITIPYTQVPNTDQINFPVLISGTYPFLANQANGGRVLNANGYDIIFTSDSAGQNLLNFEVESYNSVTGTAEFWVCIPTLSHTVNTTIYIWYGISGINDSQANSAGAWSNGYGAVWHFGAQGALSTADSTANANNGVNHGVVSATGIIGGAGAFDGTGNTYLDIPSSTSFKPATAITLESWVNMAGPGSSPSILSLDYGANGSWNSPYQAYVLNFQANTLQPNFAIAVSGSPVDVTDPASLTSGQWAHVVGTYDGTNLIEYVNGVPVASSPQSGPIDYGISQDLAIGTNSPYDSFQAVNGLIDETRISTVARSADWIATEYNNQSAPATFATLGQEFNSSGAFPTIFAVSPNPALSGQWITISGVGFGASQGSSSLSINGVILSPSTWSDSAITFNLPSNATSGPLAINVGGASSASVPFINVGTNSIAPPVGSNCPTIQPNQQVAWAWPTQYTAGLAQNPGADNGGSSAQLNGGSISLSSTLIPGTQDPTLLIGNSYWGVEWTGFQAPSIPSNATINGIYAVAHVSGSTQTSGNASTDVAGFYSQPIVLGDTFERNFLYDDTYTITEACSGDISQSNIYNVTPVTLSSMSNVDLTAFMYNTDNHPAFENSNLSVGQPGLAVVYSLPQGTNQSSSLYLIDPYLLSGANTGTINIASVIAAAIPNSGSEANGLVADGTSTAIAVYQTSVDQDVTFTIQPGCSPGIAGGATVVAWPDFGPFLTTPPSPGAPTVSIPAGDLLLDTDNNEWYAFALVQAPLGTTTCLYASPDTLTASQDSTGSSSATVNYFPRPVILVHGLWGNKASLASLDSYLTATMANSPYQNYNLNETGAINSWVTPICYSLYLPWDAFQDSYADLLKSGCETWSSNSFSVAFSNYQSDLNASNVVGGRFDIVAHSMGGLATRHFAADAAGYKSIYNRNQGAFATVITLDTPHLGSTLANFVISNADTTENAPALSIPLALWLDYCDVSDTFQQCLGGDGPNDPNTGGLNMPLAYPGTDPSTGYPYAPETGAVYSLEPNYPGIANSAANPVSIQNVPSEWLIASEFPVGSSPGSLLRGALDELIDAIEYEQGDSVDAELRCQNGTNGLGNCASDLIVTTESQFAGYTSGTPFGEPGAGTAPLQHTATWSGLSQLETQLNLGGLSDENVLSWTETYTGDTEMNQMIGCLLILATYSGCLPSGIVAAPSGSSSEMSGGTGASSLHRANSSTDSSCRRAPIPVRINGNSGAQGQAVSEEAPECVQTASELSPLIPAAQSHGLSQGSIRNDLVDIEAPSQKLKLAEENDIHLLIHARGLTSVTIAQSERGQNTSRYFDIPESHVDVPVTYHADGSAVIRVTPLRLGEIGLSIRGAFPDGSVFIKKVMLDVEPPARQPLKVFAAEAAGQNSTPRILLYLQKQGGQKFLQVHAVYDGVKEPIPIDSNAVVYRVRTNDDTPPVELDETTGLLTPIHVGRAIVESSFAGQETLTCVVVNEKFDLNTAVGEHSNCEELLHSGEKLTRFK